MGNLGIDVRTAVARIHRDQLADDIATAHDDHFQLDSLTPIPAAARGQLLEDLSTQHAVLVPEDFIEAQVHVKPTE